MLVAGSKGSSGEGEKALSVDAITGGSRIVCFSGCGVRAEEKNQGRQQGTQLGQLSDGGVVN